MLNTTTQTALANLDLAITALEAETTGNDTTEVDAAIQERADAINAFVAGENPPLPPPPPVLGPATAGARRR